MYVQCNIVTRSRNHCCNGNATVCSLWVAELSMSTVYKHRVLYKAFMAKFWRREQQTAARSSCKVPDICGRY